ncbi:hypothetical protein L208DRAFT_1378681 [Tricholoma matsutake]|nr:hypothetical protein L208DRAFT_1378681 [Tricholoma matsutake 945]
MDLDPVSNNVESLQPADGENVQMELSLAVMDQETHTECLAIQEDVQSVKGTDTAYVRHLKIYEKFMEIDQAHHIMQNPAWKVVPAHPITVVKVAAFLEYKTKWLKRTSEGQDIPGSQLGYEAIKQCISALEYCHYNNQHKDEYKLCLASRIPLRDDSCITTIQSTAQETEPEHLTEAQTAKTMGTLSGKHLH